MKLSVILCTHNPRTAHLARTLAGLASQTLPPDEWELVLIDNASSPPVELPAEWTARPTARISYEPALGLVSARLRGIAEARTNLLVFVDDDNVLAPGYLAQAEELARCSPSVGVFGGQVHGEFEVPPSPWIAARLDRLAIREFSSPTRTRQADASLAPCGAGLCVRAEVARHFRTRALADSRQTDLGRKGALLGSGDDTALAFTACDLGLEMGRFPGLHLTHLIPRERLTFRYFARLTRGHARAQLELVALRNEGATRRRQVWTGRIALCKWAVIDTMLSLLPVRKKAASPTPRLP